MGYLLFVVFTLICNGSLAVAVFERTGRHRSQLGLRRSCLALLAWAPPQWRLEKCRRCKGSTFRGWTKSTSCQLEKVNLLRMRTGIANHLPTGTGCSPSTVGGGHDVEREANVQTLGYSHVFKMLQVVLDLPHCGCKLSRGGGWRERAQPDPLAL